MLNLSGLTNKILCRVSPRRELRAERRTGFGEHPVKNPLDETATLWGFYSSGSPE